MKVNSATLPLLIALPLLVLVGISAVFFTGEDPPPPPPRPKLSDPGNISEPKPVDDPLELDPDAGPQRTTTRGVPTSAAEAEAIASEAWAAIDVIRSRLELKYKQAEYQLDRGWTLELLLRRLDRLDSHHFRGTDFAIHFPAGDEPVVDVVCDTMHGTSLPDGELRMTVNLRTGDTRKSGRIIARTADGLLLPGERETSTAREWLLNAVYEHIAVQLSRTESGLAPIDALFSGESPAPFRTGDFTATVPEGRPLAVEFACRTLEGSHLAEPMVLTLDYATRSVQLGGSRQTSWLPMPVDRNEFKKQCRWFARSTARMALNYLDSGTSRQDFRSQMFVSSGWALRSAGITPFDVKVGASSEAPWVITVEVVTSFGRPLPFQALKYVHGAGQGSGEWEDSD